MYVTDCNFLRRINPLGEVTTLAGTDAPGYADGEGTATASFTELSGVAVDAQGNVFVYDKLDNGQIWGQGYIRRVSPAGSVTTFVGGVVPPVLMALVLRQL